MKHVPDELIKEITILPAWDKRDPDPNKNYGIHGCELRFVLKGPLGAVQFVVYTNWHLPSVTKELITSKSMNQPIGGDPHWRCRPRGADLGYHSPTQRYEGQQPTKNCQYLDGRQCYYDGSSLQAEEIGMPILLQEGSEGVWKLLEKRYNQLFKRGSRS